MKDAIDLLNEEIYHLRAERTAAWDSAEHNARRAEKAEEEVKRLRDEVNVCAQALNDEEREAEQLTKMLEDVGAFARRMENRAKRNEEDAERYRWVRKNRGFVWGANTSEIDGIDAAIDAALEKDNE